MDARSAGDQKVVFLSVSSFLSFFVFLPFIANCHDKKNGIDFDLEKEDSTIVKVKNISSAM